MGNVGAELSTVMKSVEKQDALVYDERRFNFELTFDETSCLIHTGL